MSATGVPNKAGVVYARHKDDAYFTPAWCTEAIARVIGFHGIRVLDPCCGEGSILSALATTRPRGHMRGIELDDERAAKAAGLGFHVTARDSLGPESWGQPDAVITNPPFSLAMEFLVRSLREVGPSGDVVFLLRLAWMASQGRVAFHRAHPSDVYVLPKRPSFTGDGRSDSADYAWFCFGPGRGGRWSVLEIPEET